MLKVFPPVPGCPPSIPPPPEPRAGLLGLGQEKGWEEMGFQIWGVECVESTDAGSLR